MIFRDNVGGPRLKHVLAQPMAYGVLVPDKYAGPDGVPLVRIGDVEHGRVSIDGADRISQAWTSSFAELALEKGTL